MGLSLIFAVGGLLQILSGLGYIALPALIAYIVALFRRNASPPNDNE
jgi:hypothetical protein